MEQPGYLEHFVGVDALCVGGHSRFLSMSNSDKSRKRLRKKLMHMEKQLDVTKAVLISSVTDLSDRIQRLLSHEQSIGDALCCLISYYDDLDGLSMDISSAIELVFRRAPGTFISIWPGALVYYEGEYNVARYLFTPARL